MRRTSTYHEENEVEQINRSRSQRCANGHNSFFFLLRRGEQGSELRTSSNFIMRERSAGFGPNVAGVVNYTYSRLAPVVQPIHRLLRRENRRNRINDPRFVKASYVLNIKKPEKPDPR